MRIRTPSYIYIYGGFGGAFEPPRNRLYIIIHARVPRARRIYYVVRCAQKGKIRARRQTLNTRWPARLVAPFSKTCMTI